LNEAMNLSLDALRAADVDSLNVAGSVPTGSDAGPGGVPTQVPGAGRYGAAEPLSAQVGQTELPTLAAGPMAARALSGRGSLGMPPEDWFESSVPAEGTSGAGRIEPAAPAQTTQPTQPAQATQASAKVSAWSDGGLDPGATAPTRQLNSYEVDSRTLRVQPWTADAVSGAVTGAVAETVAAKAALDWRRPDWQGAKVDDQLARSTPLLIGQVPVEPQPAPIRVRFAAVLVDGMLTLGAVLAATLAVTLNLRELPGIKEMALGAAAVLVVLGILYQLLFLTLGEATPGMKCAHVALRTFENEKTTRAQRFGRLGALLLALLPAGLGVLWALFDRDHLSMHDRLSGTYLRKD